MPSFVLIGVALTSGQLTDGAPGASPIGQIILVATTLITLAPWLAVATVCGAVVPGVRRKA